MEEKDRKRNIRQGGKWRENNKQRVIEEGRERVEMSGLSSSEGLVPALALDVYRRACLHFDPIEIFF